MGLTNYYSGSFEKLLDISTTHQIQEICMKRFFFLSESFPISNLSLLKNLTRKEVYCRLLRGVFGRQYSVVNQDKPLECFTINCHIIKPNN